MFNIIKLRAENKRLKEENKNLKEELEQKKIIIQYLNGCISKATERSVELLRKILTMKSCEDLNFPNSSEEADRQISIHDILEN